MGESLIVRKGGGIKGSWKLMTEIITSNTNWTVPANIKNGEVTVMLFGGGGSSAYDINSQKGYSIGGGGGGYMRKQTLTLASGASVPITIGAGGIPNNTNYKYGVSGGITSFGSYFSASGGEGSKEGNGGNGGSGGGAGYGNGGIGYNFGGGGSVLGNSGNANNASIMGGESKGYGGAGGSCICMYTYYKQTANAKTVILNKQNASPYGKGISGYGSITQLTDGNSTVSLTGASAGVNKYGTNELVGCAPISSTGSPGSASSVVNLYNASYYTTYYAFGGGGGYGGNGGKGCYIRYEYSMAGGGGGGGGYYGSGGNASGNAIFGARMGMGGGGGGGYGNSGYDGSGTGSDYSGSQRYAYGGGGGGYGPSGYGHGGSFHIDRGNGKSGICIIQYYQLVLG